MAKRKSGETAAEQMNKWCEGLNKMFDEQRAIDEKLSPSVSQLTYLVNYTQDMQRLALQMKVLSDLAHSSVVSFEQVQSALNRQKKELKRDLEFVMQMVFPEEDKHEKVTQD